MARHANDEFADMPGQDSFLDVLTNMVGIIILLVVVTGLRTSQATVRAAVEKFKIADNAEETASKDELQNAQRAALATESELKGLMRQVVDVHGETALREQERDHLTTFVAAVQQELDERRSALSADQQGNYDLRRKLAESQATLENLSREQVALLSQPIEGEVETIENQPTPLAQRSAANRIYMYVSEGRVAVIPKELFDAMGSDANENVWRLKNESRVTRTVGPIGGFRLRYLLALQPIRLQGPAASMPGGNQQVALLARPQLVTFLITPETKQFGEPVQDALLPNSAFRQALRENPADTSIVVIAVYPDSIRELHQIEHELHAARYSIACIPFNMGEPMRGTPAGSSQQTRSAEVFTQ